MKYNKKAAMFGLDARIALAVFGTLSIISGAALYSALKKVEVTARVQTLVETTKALEAYIIDTNSIPGTHPDDAEFIDIKELVESTKEGWRGPYTKGKITSYKSFCTDCVIDASEFADTSDPSTLSFLGKVDSAAGTVKMSTCTSGEYCYMWISLSHQNNEIAESVDKKIDGAIGYGTGDIRLSPSGSTTHIWMNTGVPINQFQ